MGVAMIDIRIMAHPKRADNVSRLLQQLKLPEAAVCWDDRPTGGDAMYTARKAWTANAPKGATHRLVLQDDVEISNNFLDIVRKAAKLHPWAVHTFITFERLDGYANPTGTPYYAVDSVPGPAIMMPIRLVPRMISYCDAMKDAAIGKHNDLLISEWCRRNRIKMIATSPCIVQHIGDVSLLPASYDWVRRSQNYDANGAGDWDNGNIAMRWFDG
uniref:Uncharacterized protein n=1 Tax=Siphoviridae sp. ctdcr45 TaxID=2825580 RepID=A0A8S5Q9G5_9CAUD|nr:MAG TPA: hypothetical protein [Siphoviridae sp. ctdcr45]